MAGQEGTLPQDVQCADFPLVGRNCCDIITADACDVSKSRLFCFVLVLSLPFRRGCCRQNKQIAKSDQAARASCTLPALFAPSLQKRNYTERQHVGTRCTRCAVAWVSFEDFVSFIDFFLVPCGLDQFLILIDEHCAGLKQSLRQQPRVHVYRSLAPSSTLPFCGHFVHAELS